MQCKWLEIPYVIQIHNDKRVLKHLLLSETEDSFPLCSLFVPNTLSVSLFVNDNNK